MYLTKTLQLQYDKYWLIFNFDPRPHQIKRFVYGFGFSKIGEGWRFIFLFLPKKMLSADFNLKSSRAGKLLYRWEKWPPKICILENMVREIRRPIFFLVWPNFEYQPITLSLQGIRKPMKFFNPIKITLEARQCTCSLERSLLHIILFQYQFNINIYISISF